MGSGCGGSATATSNPLFPGCPINPIIPQSTNQLSATSPPGRLTSHHSPSAQRRSTTIALLCYALELCDTITPNQNWQTVAAVITLRKATSNSKVNKSQPRFLQDATQIPRPRPRLQHICRPVLLEHAHGRRNRNLSSPNPRHFRDCRARGR